MSEFEVHKNIIKHIRYRAHKDVLAIHIPNNPRGPKHGKHLQALGMLKGAPDLVYAISDGRVIWHEIKTETGKVEREQKKVHDFLRGIGHVVLVTFGQEDALQQLKMVGVIR